MSALAAIRDMFIALGDDKRASIVQNTFLAAPSLKTAEDVPRLVLNQKDDDFFRKRIVEQATVTPSKESHKRIAAAFEQLTSELTADGERTPHPRHWQRLLDAIA